ncbi:NHL repeat-containing protein [Marinospirillum sp. MEB164]|uniref:NHL repeat-containing protein n=1 Tax=Marinospirillum alkalitolerans TaxID=3123374 RepID=A0ABW8PUM8_9GAMM
MTQGRLTPQEHEAMLSYTQTLGRYFTALPALPSSDLERWSMNTPVGSCQDQEQRLWVTDTAHNRLLIFNHDFTQLLAQYGGYGQELGQFNMPFRLLAHPERAWIYVTDMANKRIQILDYQQGVDQIQAIADFGPDFTEPLAGPNGIVFHQGLLCIADEFYEGPDGASRLVICDEEGRYQRSIHQVHCPNSTEPLDLLWPQGLSLDAKGRIYIANTGMNNLLRCDWSGQGEVFPDTGRAVIDGLALSRDVACYQQWLLLPGAESNAIAVYHQDGQRLGALGGFFAPMQITPSAQAQQLLINEPLLGQVGLYQVDLRQLHAHRPLFPRVVRTAGDARNQQGQLHFVTALAGLIEPSSQPVSSPSPAPSASSLLPPRTGLLSSSANLMPLPSWLHLLWSWQVEWLERWQRTWWQLLTTQPEQEPSLWLLDSGNTLVRHTDPDLTGASLPLLPGTLGMASFIPKKRLWGHLQPDTPLLVTSNYLNGLITLYQLHPQLKTWVPYRFFGGFGTAPWQFERPQGIAIDPINQDILIADSGQHRIARWRITTTGICGLVSTFGQLGDQEGEFNTPSDLCFDPQGRCYVVDQFNHRIQIFNQQDVYQGQFGQPGYSTDQAEFLLPTSIAYTEDHLIVSDLVNRALKVLTLEGEPVCHYQGFGAGEDSGQLWMPYLIHAQGTTVYVPDCALNLVRVYQFNQEGSA